MRKIWMKVAEPTVFERFLIKFAQFGFLLTYLSAYILTPKTSHRMIGYFEEEAVKSYTDFLKEIDEGKITNHPAPRIAIDYYNLKSDARIREVILAIRADEAEHRDANHHFADRLAAGEEKVEIPLDHESKKRK
jgi:demethoxyubiquinone hydroxylase (CLK1/Coq7/Cat5 family)